jgi:hypothetical protein
MAYSYPVHNLGQWAVNTGITQHRLTMSEPLLQRPRVGLFVTCLID